MARRKRKGPPSEAKREQGRRLAARMEREGGKFVKAKPIEEPSPDLMAEAQAEADQEARLRLASWSAPSQASPPRPRQRRGGPPSSLRIETRDQELVNRMNGRNDRDDDSLLAKSIRRRERRLGG